MNCKQCAHWDKCSKTNGKTRYYGETIAADNVEKLCEWFILMADVTTKSEIIEKFLENAKQKGYCLVHAEGLAEDLAIKIAMAKIETAKEIFAEIEKNECHDISGKTTMYMLFAEEFAELKDKYCGKDTNVPTKKTNFDRIKEMSVDEMAVLLCKGSICIADDDRQCKPGKCENCLKEWLESEVKT